MNILLTSLFLLKKKRFGIEFAPSVVQADGNVKKLAWRICVAKNVLVSNLDHLTKGIFFIPLHQMPWDIMSILIK
jgi:hypothetical protein